MGNFVARLGRAAALLAGAGAFYAAGTMGAGCSNATADTGGCDCAEPVVKTVECVDGVAELTLKGRGAAGLVRASAFATPKPGAFPDLDPKYRGFITVPTLVGDDVLLAECIGDAMASVTFVIP